MAMMKGRNQVIAHDDWPQLIKDGVLMRFAENPAKRNCDKVGMKTGLGSKCNWMTISGSSFSKL
jgi:hypothetical protein